MQDLNDKITGGELAATEWNEVASEIQNVIEGLGITLSSGDLNQLGKAISGYVSNGTFYLDSGTVNAFVLLTIDSKQSPPSYTTGFEIRFIANISNTSASTVNVASLGVKNLKLEGGLDLTSGIIKSGDLVRAFFNGTDFIVQLSTQFSGSSVRNYVLDGRFDFWFESTSQTTNGYGSDTMWQNLHAGSTKVNTRQAFTPGELPDVTTAEFYSRTTVTSVPGVNNVVQKVGKIENVRTLAGVQSTLSFLAKADAPKNMSVDFNQVFGPGGSPNLFGVAVKKFNLTTDWQSFEFTLTLPSIAGKVLGTSNHVSFDFWFDAGSAHDPRTDSLGQQSGVFDIANVQWEKGAKASDFVQDDITESLLKVNRFFYRHQSADLSMHTQTFATSSTLRGVNFTYFAEMSTLPSTSNITISSGSSAVVQSTGITSIQFVGVANSSTGAVEISGFTLDSRL